MCGIRPVYGNHAARQVAEAVEDALPVLEVEEHRDPAEGQKDGARDPGRHLRPLARPERGHQRLRPEQPRAPRHQRGEHIFAPIFGTGLLLPGMILSRGLGYYTELLVSAVLTIVANFTIGKGKKVRENVGNL